MMDFQNHGYAALFTYTKIKINCLLDNSNLYNISGCKNSIYTIVSYTYIVIKKVTL